MGLAPCTPGGSPALGLSLSPWLATPWHRSTRPLPGHQCFVKRSSLDAHGDQGLCRRPPPTEPGAAVQGACGPPGLGQLLGALRSPAGSSWKEPLWPCLWLLGGHLGRPVEAPAQVEAGADWGHGPWLCVGLASLPWHWKVCVGVPHPRPPLPQVAPGHLLFSHPLGTPRTGTALSLWSQVGIRGELASVTHPEGPGGDCLCRVPCPVQGDTGCGCKQPSRLAEELNGAIQGPALKPAPSCYVAWPPPPCLCLGLPCETGCREGVHPRGRCKGGMRWAEGGSRSRAPRGPCRAH